MVAIKRLQPPPALRQHNEQLWLEITPHEAPAQHQLWLSVHIPLLGLHALKIHQQQDPIVLTDGEGSRQRVHLCNAAAQTFGIHAGMKISTATSLCGHLIVQARDEQREQRFLLRLARWAQRFTPSVSVHPPQCLLLEIAASLVLFGGAQQLCARIQRILQRQHITATLALANTTIAALWLNRANSPYALDIDKSTAFRLGPLALEHTDIDESTQQNIQAIGINTLGELMRLPRDGLMRRYGKKLLLLLDRAYGKLTDIPELIAAPHCFDERIELSYECTEWLRLMPVVETLITQLCLRLRAVQCGISTFELLFHHKASDKTTITIGLALPSRDPEQMLRLCQAKLEATQLQQATRELQLKALHWQPLASENLDHFDVRTRRSDIAVLIEQLRARMADDGAYQISCRADYRPERSLHKQMMHQEKIIHTETQRPLYLLPAPQHIDDAHALTFIRGPERIDGGWWSEEDIKRDYYVVKTPRGACWWIFRDRRNKQWFKHGVFA